VRSVRKKVILGVVFLALFVCGGVTGKSKTKIKIGPGPREMSAEEKAIVADPEAGIEHGVILVEETYLDEDLGTDMQTTYHLRAKILSQEARGMGDIVLPDKIGDVRLRNWWAFTITPDGEVIDLTEEELTSQVLVKKRRRKVSVLKGAMPGVVPGSVIDLGFKIKSGGYYPANVTYIQQAWPVRLFKYRWRPTPFLHGSFVVRGTDSMGIETKRDGRTILVTAENLRGVPAEEFMPPAHEVKASLVTYYTDSSSTASIFWDKASGAFSKYIDRDLEDLEDKIKEILAELPEDGDIRKKLAAAYRRVIDIDVEEEEKEAEDPIDTNHLMVGLARSLGAQAYLILVPDRTEEFWDASIKSMRQFDGFLVEVQLPDKGGTILLDPGSRMAFGTVPWWFTGGDAFRIGSIGASRAFLAPGQASGNQMTTDVWISFSDDGSTLKAQWKTRGTGQVGYLNRLALANLPEDEKTEFVDSLCAGDSGGEVLESHLEDSQRYDDPYVLSCTLELLSAVPTDPAITATELDLSGPWVEPPPELHGGKRYHTVVFPYPFVHITSIEVLPPPGFEIAGWPSQAGTRSHLGRYKRNIHLTGSGLQVDRAFAVLPLAISQAEYNPFCEFLETVRTGDSLPLEFVRTGEP
jgi:hypothetical protein